MVYCIAWQARHGMWYSLAGTIWFGLACMTWSMIWPGSNGMVYGMAWQARYGIFYGLAGMTWFIVWPCMYDMVYGMAWQARYGNGMAWQA